MSARWVVVGVAAVLGALGLLGLALEGPHFWDPCMTWGMQSGGSASLSPGGPCRSVSGTSETRTGAAVRLLLVDGTAIIAAGLSAWGALHRRPRPILAAGLLMAGETVILFLGISAAFILTLGAAGLFLTVGLGWRSLLPPGPDLPRPPTTRRQEIARWVAVAASLAPILYMGYLSVAGCASMAVEVVEPGAPQGTPHCSSNGSWVILFFLLPPVVAGAGLLVRDPPLAWVGAVTFAGVSVLFGFSMGFLIPYAVVLLIAVAVWHLLGHQRSAAPPPTP